MIKALAEIREMKMKTWLILILLTLLTLTACAAPSSASPTPTIVRLDRLALTPTPAIEEVADIVPPATSTSTSTTTTTVTEATATATLEPEPEATSSPTVTATLKAAQAEIVAAGLNVREGPGAGYAAIGTVAQGDILDITSISADSAWLQIVTPDGKSGWISSQSTYICILGSLDNVQMLNVEPSNVEPSNIQPATQSGGKLIFATSSGGDLYSVNAECASLPEGCGTDLQKLTSGVIDPVVSPDGTQVAYTRWDGAKMGALYVLNLNDGSEQVVAGDIARPKSPTWSKDGQEIIISFQHGGTVNPQPECREFDSDDGMQLPNFSEITSMHVSDNGEVKICFIRQEDLQWGLRQIDLATGQAEDLPADLYSFNPTWDPQNSWRVIYDGLRGLMQLDVASGELQPFTTDVRDTAPVFSPDGQTLALTYKQHDHWEVYTYDLASGSRQRLTKGRIS
jgi:hypothetical protein